MKRYMLATKAFHILGDISSDYPDLCEISAQDNNNYYGIWSTGFGFIDVRFPKNTTRDLNKDEIDKYKSHCLTMGGMVWKLDIEEQNNKCEINNLPDFKD